MNTNNNNNNSTTSKKTLGRRKIEIKRIEKKSSLQVTFTKRRMGLFRKASELSIVCGANIAILVESPAGKIFDFGNPSAESVIHRFQNGSPEPGTNFAVGEGSRVKYAEAVKKLEGEIKMEKRIKEEVGCERKMWWEDNFEGMQLHELEEYVQALEGLRNNVMHGLENLEKHKQASSSSSNFLALTYHGHSYGQGFDGGRSSFEGMKMEGEAQMVKDDGVNYLMDPSEDFDNMDNVASFYNDHI